MCHSTRPPPPPHQTPHRPDYGPSRRRAARCSHPARSLIISESRQNRSFPAFSSSFAMPANVLFPPPPARRTQLLAAPSTVVCASRGAWPLALSRTSPASLLLPVARPHQITRLSLLSPSFPFFPSPSASPSFARRRGVAFARLRVAPHTPCHTYPPSTAIRSTPRLRRSRASPRPSPRNRFPAAR